MKTAIPAVLLLTTVLGACQPLGEIDDPAGAPAPEITDSRGRRFVLETPANSEVVNPMVAAIADTPGHRLDDLSLADRLRALRPRMYSRGHTYVLDGDDDQLMRLMAGGDVDIPVTEGGVPAAGRRASSGDPEVESVASPLVVSDTASHPASTAVQIRLFNSAGKEWRGSGVVIGRSTVLTAAHVLFTPDGRAAYVEAIPGAHPSGGDEPAAPFGIWTNDPAKFRDIHGFDPAGEFRMATPSCFNFREWHRECDFGVLDFVSNPIGDSTGWLGTDTNLWRFCGQGRASIETRGYPGNQPKYTQWHQTGTVRTQDTYSCAGRTGCVCTMLSGMVFDFQSFGGQSGSGAYDSSQRVVGIATDTMDFPIKIFVSYMGRKFDKTVRNFVASNSAWP